jgi:hypothetical protein
MQKMLKTAYRSQTKRGIYFRLEKTKRGLRFKDADKRKELETENKGIDV